MIRFARWTTLAGVLGMLAMPAEAPGDEQEIRVGQVPAAVLRAARAKFPAAKIEGALKEVDGDETTYELALKVEGRRVDVALESDGTILEVERELDADELPEAIKAAVAAMHPGAKITTVETVARGEGGPVRYEIAVTTELVLDARGRSADEGRKGRGENRPAAVKPAVADESVEAVFRSDPAVAELYRERKQAQIRLQTAKRSTRNTNDPSLRIAQQRVDDIESEIEQLWLVRGPAIRLQLTREIAGEMDQKVERAGRRSEARSDGREDDDEKGERKAKGRHDEDDGERRTEAKKHGREDEDGDDEREKRGAKAKSKKREHDDEDDDEKDEHRAKAKSKKHEHEDEDDDEKDERKAKSRKREHKDNERAKAKSKKREHDDEDDDHEKGERKAKAKSKKHKSEADDHKKAGRKSKSKSKSKKHKSEADDDDGDDDEDEDCEDDDERD